MKKFLATIGLFWLFLGFRWASVAGYFSSDLHRAAISHAHESEFQSIESARILEDGSLWICLEIVEGRCSHNEGTSRRAGLRLPVETLWGELPAEGVPGLHSSSWQDSEHWVINPRSLVFDREQVVDGCEPPLAPRDEPEVELVEVPALDPGNAIDGLNGEELHALRPSKGFEHALHLEPWSGGGEVFAPGKLLTYVRARPDDFAGWHYYRLRVRPLKLAHDSNWAELVLATAADVVTFPLQLVALLALDH